MKDPNRPTITSFLLNQTFTLMSNANFVEVGSPENFQKLLSTDLKRISIINFWAPWAEPCLKMNEVVKELAKKYPAALFLQVCVCVLCAHSKTRRPISCLTHTHQFID